MNADELSRAVYSGFANIARPQHFTDYAHCEECAEYDRQLQSVEGRALSASDIGTVAWGPIPFLTPQAMAYYLPRLIELALNGARNKENDPFVCQFLNQVARYGKGAKQFSCLSAEHKLLMLRSLEYISAAYLPEIEAQFYGDMLQEALHGWRA